MPVTIPFSFGTRSGNVPASNLDDDFQALASFANGLETDITTLQGQMATVIPPFNLSGESLGAATILDLQGTSLGWDTNKNGLRWEVAIGTDGAPVMAAGAAVKMSATRDITVDPPAGCANGIDPVCGSVVTIAGKSLSTSTMMGVGLYVEQTGDQVDGITGGSGDQLGIYSLGLKEGGQGFATGGYFEGRRNAVGSGAGIGLVGAEITQRNITATDCVHNAAGGNCHSVWVTGLGSPGLMGVGVAIRDSGAGGAGKFQAGFQCTDYSVDDYGGGCFEDDSQATRSIRIGGSHQFGIDATGATLTGPAILLATNHNIAWGTGGTPAVLNAVEATGVYTFTAANATGGTLSVLGRGAVLLGATPFANLGAVVAGTLRYCDDCSATSPCTGAGTGRFARGEGAAWNCS